jgi:hypothetical protein
MEISDCDGQMLKRTHCTGTTDVRLSGANAIHALQRRGSTPLSRL